MNNKISCPSCSMTFFEKIRLERHVKKAHPTKRNPTKKPSSDFNHADISHQHFTAF